MSDERKRGEATHLTLSMNQIRRERRAAATIVRVLKPLSPRKRVAVLHLAAVCAEERPTPEEGT